MRHHPAQQRGRQEGRRTRKPLRRKQRRALLRRLLPLGGGGGRRRRAPAAPALREAALLSRVEAREEGPSSGEERRELNEGATAREQQAWGEIDRWPGSV